MRLFQLGVAAGLLACAAQGRCASVIVERHAHPGGVAHAFFLDGGVHNGLFNTVDFLMQPSSSAAPFINQSSGLAGGVPQLPGDAFSFLNRGVPFTFDGPPQDLMIGDWPMLGPKNSSTQVGFASGPLGQKINTSLLPGGRLFLANVMLPSTAATFTGSFRLIENGVLLQEIVVPEPATGALAVACAGAGLVIRRTSRRLARG